jgi:hypothetical protein
LRSVEVEHLSSRPQQLAGVLSGDLGERAATETGSRAVDDALHGVDPEVAAQEGLRVSQSRIVTSGGEQRLHRHMMQRPI